MEPEKRPCITPRMNIGLDAYVLGVVFTLDNLGVLDAVRVLRFWPIVLVAIGVVRLTRSDRHTAGWIYLLIGAWLLIVNLHLVPNRYWSMWPLVLVAIGIAMVQRAIRGPREAGQAPGDAFVRGLAVLGGIEKRSASQEFRGGDVAAFMGGINIDLRQARIGAQDAVLEVFAMW